MPKRHVIVVAVLATAVMLNMCRDGSTNMPFSWTLSVVPMPEVAAPFEFPRGGPEVVGDRLPRRHDAEAVVGLPRETLGGQQVRRRRCLGVDVDAADDADRRRCCGADNNYKAHRVDDVTAIMCELAIEQRQLCRGCRHRCYWCRSR